MAAAAKWRQVEAALTDKYPRLGYPAWSVRRWRGR